MRIKSGSPGAGGVRGAGKTAGANKAQSARFSGLVDETGFFPTEDGFTISISRVGDASSWFSASSSA